METKEIIKFGLLLFLYLVLPAILGFLLRGHRAPQRIAFFLMCFMTISGFLSASEWGLTLGFVPEYRGHARGFHFFFNEVLALSLILAAALERKSKFKPIPPGLWLYLLYCAMGLISLLNAPSSLYVAMAAFKAFKAALIFIAAYNFVRNEKDIQFFLRTMCFTLLWQFMVALKMKYLDGKHQIMGTFEHQNALAMYVNLVAMVLLAAGASAKGWGANLYLFVFLTAAVIVEFTLSRAGLVFFGLGTVGVMILVLIEKFTSRRVIVVSVVAFCAVAGFLKTMDSIINRFNDPFTYDSKQTRIMLRAASFKMFNDYPLGIGWNNYGVTINRPFTYGEPINEYFRRNGERVDTVAPKGIEEGLYYLLLAETGFQSLACFAVLILLFLWWNVRAAWQFRGQFLGTVSIGIAVGCGINYLQSFVERVLTQPRNLMMWLILLALTAKIETWRRQVVRQKRQTRNQSGGSPDQSVLLAKQTAESRAT
ncbi:MAG: O-antigen ligase family protein [Verrucomicrobiota bacterium]